MMRQQMKKIYGEAQRTYFFPNGTTVVENVTAMCVRPSGQHRLETKEGRKVIVPTGWLSLDIIAKNWSL